MHDAALPVRIDSRDGATVLAPRGDIDMSRAPAFREHVRRAIQSGPSRVVIDLSEVEYMDSSGLATLVGVYGPVLMISGTIVAKCIFLWCLYLYPIFLRV